MPPTSLVGRDRDLAALRKLLRDPAPSFLTMAGVGGVGKSPLAAELAASDVIACRGRVASVPLDAVSDASMVLPAIAGALGDQRRARRVRRAVPVRRARRRPDAPRPGHHGARPGAAPALADLHVRTPA